MSTAKYQHGSTEPGWMEQTDTPRTDAQYENNTSDYQRRLVSEDLERKLAAEIANRKKCCRDGNQISDELFDTQLKLKASQAEVERLRDENKELRDENKELRDENKELRTLMRRSIALTDKILEELPPPFPFEWFVDLSEKASAIDEKYSYLLK
jgi:chromosome segregation ATPase